MRNGPRWDCLMLCEVLCLHGRPRWLTSNSILRPRLGKVTGLLCRQALNADFVDSISLRRLVQVHENYDLLDAVMQPEFPACCSFCARVYCDCTQPVPVAPLQRDKHPRQKEKRRGKKAEGKERNGQIRVTLLRSPLFRRRWSREKDNASMYPKACTDELLIKKTLA